MPYILENRARTMTFVHLLYQADAPWLRLDHSQSSTIRLRRRNRRRGGPSPYRCLRFSGSNIHAGRIVAIAELERDRPLVTFCLHCRQVDAS